MNDIGNNFKEAREGSSVTLEEASVDTEIPVTALEQIEEGAIGSFKDIFKLKDYLRTYAKYLGLDADKVIDEFNEYMFEYTSKIPVEELEKAIEEKENEEYENTLTGGIQAVSPYLRPKEDNSKSRIVLTIIIVIILVAIALVWAIKQVM